MPSLREILACDGPAAADAFWAMLRREGDYICRDYLRDERPGPGARRSCLRRSNDAVAVTATDRMNLVDWCYKIVDSCRFGRETVAVAMSMVDRYLSSPRAPTDACLADHRRYQLLVLAALYTSIKVSEPVSLGSEVFAATSVNLYTAREIEEAEMELLRGLEWRIHAPTAAQLAHHLFAMVAPRVPGVDEGVWDFLLDEVALRAENAVRDYPLSLRRPSVVAMAALFDALDDVDPAARAEVLGALLAALGERFVVARPEELFATKGRLRRLVKGEAAVDDEAGSDATDDEVRTPDSSYTDRAAGGKECAGGSPRTVDHLSSGGPIYFA